MTLSVVLDERYADLAAQFQRAQIGILRNTLKKYGSGASAALDAPEPPSSKVKAIKTAIATSFASDDNSIADHGLRHYPR